jgi:hypothetical protein
MRTRSNPFFGWRVVGAVFVLAMFGWGVGFYGPPVYLHAVRETRGWPVALVSTNDQDTDQEMHGHRWRSAPALGRRSRRERYASEWGTTHQLRDRRAGRGARFRPRARSNGGLDGGSAA